MTVDDLLIENEYRPRRPRSRNSNARPKIRMFSADQWSRQNFILSRGELAFDTTENRFKIGDGETTWNQLDYLFIDVTGNTQGLMTVTQFTEYTALFESDFLNYQASITAQLVEFQTSLDSFVETVDGLQAQFQEVLDNNVDLSVLISNETFAQYTAGQSALNDDFSTRLQTLESQNAPDLSGYATQGWVTAQISNINVNVDLSSYATNAELQALSTAVGSNDQVLAERIEDLQSQISNIQVGNVDLTQVNSDIAAVNGRIDALISDLESGVYGTGGGGDDGGGLQNDYDLEHIVGNADYLNTLVVDAGQSKTWLYNKVSTSTKQIRLMRNGYPFGTKALLEIKYPNGVVASSAEDTGGVVNPVVPAEALGYLITVTNNGSETGNFYLDI